MAINDPREAFLPTRFVSRKETVSTVAFLADPGKWETAVLRLRRRRGEGSEVGYLFPGEPHVYLSPRRGGSHYAYPSFEAILVNGWLLEEGDD